MFDFKRSELLWKAILRTLWQQILTIIQTKLSKPSFDTWLKSTKATVFNDSTVVICAPNNFAQEWLESRYTKLIEGTIYDFTGKHVSVKFIIETEEQNRNLPAVQPIVIPPKGPAIVAGEENFTNMMNPKYTFDTFVIGAGNRFAHAASLAVAEAPAKAYNPLFLYGGVGLGKTHLMHAIGHYILEHNPDTRVLYISSEKFTNEFINAIRDNRGESFRNKYRTIDVLLIDDIQFLLVKKERKKNFSIPLMRFMKNVSKLLFPVTGRPKKFQLWKNGSLQV